MPLLVGELDKLENWRAQLPPANNLLVSLRKLDRSRSDRRSCIRSARCA